MAEFGALHSSDASGESMVEFGPDGVARATYVDLAKSKLIGSGDWYDDIVGGFAAAVR